MIDWSADAKNNTGSFTKAAPCSINRGSVDSDGSKPPRPARMYVDDAMLAAIGAHRMRLTLAAMIEAIFVVMGKEDLQYRQCPLAMDKRQSLVVGPRQTMLGLIVDTRSMTVGIPPEYIDEVITLLDLT
ncbi:hypothetical protein ACHAWU_000618 [Discostella pseudostelligera]|uniref:Uncharacterized protein n=1 Tax=Discostella pseudostelligera TaxID=259834 RepID=A0ABD3M7D6_9STRA